MTIRPWPAKEAWDLLGDRPIRHIHAWQRDRAEAGEHGFEPSITPDGDCGLRSLAGRLPSSRAAGDGNHFQEPAAPGDWIADCVLVDPSNGGSGFTGRGRSRLAGRAGSSTWRRRRRP